MRRLLPFVTLLALAGCGRDEPEPRRQTQAKSPSDKPPAAAVPQSRSEEEARETGRDAAAVLRRYYDHIEAGRYDDAWAMRGGEAEGAEAFVRNFAAYQSYKVTLGPASEPVSGNGWTFVDVPIMITGTMKGGKGFGSTGSVTLRRASGAAGATSAQKNWHIYTGD
ncbi:MAG TPA: hypothetical protein VIA98_08870 [Allosphingosinicella sp.]|jgi:hypothetical protein